MCVPVLPEPALRFPGQAAYKICSDRSLFPGSGNNGD